MRTYKNRFKALPLIVTAGVVILAGCSRTEADEREPERTPVRFVLSAGDMTRVATDAGTYKATFEAGDEVGIYAVHYTSGTGSLTASDNILHNRKLTYDGVDWTLDGEPFYVPVEGKVDFFAYYPYDQNATDPTAMTLSVGADQRAQADFSSSDLMTAVASGVTPQANTVSLTFRHNLAILELRFGAGSMSQNKLVVLEDYPVAPVGFSLQTLATVGTFTSGTATDKNITMYRPANDVAWALLPPGKTEGLILKVHGNTFSIDTDIELNSGKVTSHNVNIPSWPETNEVGARYYLNGRHVGYVWKVNTTDNEGKSNNDGLVIYKEYLTEALLNDPWDGKYERDLILNDRDGWENFEILKAKVPGWRNLEPWAWCADLGDGWYVPTWDEFTSCDYSRGSVILDDTKPTAGDVDWRQFGNESTIAVEVWLRTDMISFAEAWGPVSSSASREWGNPFPPHVRSWGMVYGLTLAFRKY